MSLMFSIICLTATQTGKQVGRETGFETQPCHCKPTYYRTFVPKLTAALEPNCLGPCWLQGDCQGDLEQVTFADLAASSLHL